jgi:large subunit ribosomal protein L5
MESLKKKIESISPKFIDDFGLENKMAVPRIEKVVLNAGVGRIATADKKRVEFIAGRLTQIAGQKTTTRPARKSIATFKTREGDPIGVAVTLRGERMYAFLDKLIHIAIPRMRDFKGLTSKSVDEMGNLTIGISEHTIFPETSDEDLRDVFGFAITIVTTSHNKEVALAFLKGIGFPFK